MAARCVDDELEHCQNFDRYEEKKLRMTAEMARAVATCHAQPMRSGYAATDCGSHQLLKAAKSEQDSQAVWSSSIGSDKLGPCEMFLDLPTCACI